MASKPQDGCPRSDPTVPLILFAVMEVEGLEGAAQKRRHLSP